MEIEIENKPFAVDYWFSGTYKKEDKLYLFTIHDSERIEITWCDDTPENNEQIEQEIINKYTQR